MKNRGNLSEKVKLGGNGRIAIQYNYGKRVFISTVFVEKRDPSNKHKASQQFGFANFNEKESDNAMNGSRVTDFQKTIR